MKTILCFGDSNVWGNIPGSFDQETGLSGKYPKNKRWTGILQKNLGDEFDVIVDGINARTTNMDELVPGRPYKNGLVQLPITLEINYPIDLVAFWIGTNDTKIQFDRTLEDLKKGMQQLIACVRNSNKGPQAQSPKILLIAPQPVIKVPNLHPQLDEGSIEKSNKIALIYQELAKEENCEFFDAGSLVRSSEIDGVHLDENACETLGKTLATKIRQIL